MKNPLLLFVLPFFFPFLNQPLSITELTEKILANMEAYVNDFPEEKAFLHLDKNIYAAGDNIWFSAYLTAGSPDVPSPLSKVLYVDFLDNEGKLIQQKTIEIKDGHGAGDFRLDNFLREGTYQVKAYSHWMRGFGKDAVFSTPIQVFEPYNLSFQPAVVWEKSETAQGTSYKGTVTVLDRSLKPLTTGKISATWKIGAENVKTEPLTLDAEGRGKVAFTVPIEKEGAIASLLLNWEENEEFSVTRQLLLPFSSRSVDVQFLPEGGDLIAGFANKIAVRAVYPNGLPAQIKAKVQTASEEITLETNAFGLGMFSLTPEQGKNYTAEISLDGNIRQVALPQTKASGVNLTVDNSNEALVNILIQAKEFGQISPTGEALLVVHARGRIGHMQVINLANGVTGARIRKAQLVSGINQIAIFEPGGTPLAERLIYISGRDERRLTVNSPKVDLTPRAKNTWTFQIDGEGFEGGNYSASIVDAQEQSYQWNSSILSYLKLESELQGQIHQPIQLFGTQRDDAGIELVMLTHGWRRFDWEEVLAKKFTNSNFIEQGINITGTVSPKDGNKRGLGGGIINVLSKGNEQDFLAVEYTDNGRFIIDDMAFTDTTQLVLTVKDRRLKELVQLQLDPPLAKYQQWEGFSPTLKSFEANSYLQEFLTQAEKRRQSSAAFDDMGTVDIEEFVVKAQKYQPEQENINRMYGKGDVSLIPAEIGGFEGYYDIWQLLQGRFAGVNIKPNPMGAPTVTIRGAGSLNQLSPIFLLDNVPVDAQFISSISPRDLAAVDVFKDGASLAIFGSAGAGGAIAFYTKRGAGVFDAGDGVFNLRFPGYSTAREFYMPRYDKEASPKPDFRSTLYWSPRLSLNGNTGTIEFFNNDVVQGYKLVIQGMDKSGKLSYFEKEIMP